MPQLQLVESKEVDSDGRIIFAMEPDHPGHNLFCGRSTVPCKHQQDPDGLRIKDYHTGRGGQMPNLVVNMDSSRTKDQGSRIKNQGSKMKDQGSNKGSKIKDQVPEIKDQGSRIKDQGSRIKDQRSRIKDQGLPHRQRRTNAKPDGLLWLDQVFLLNFLLCFFKLLVASSQSGSHLREGS